MSKNIFLLIALLLTVGAYGAGLTSDSELYTRWLQSQQTGECPDETLTGNLSYALDVLDKKYDFSKYDVEIYEIYYPGEDSKYKLTSIDSKESFFVNVLITTKQDSDYQISQTAKIKKIRSLKTNSAMEHLQEDGKSFLVKEELSSLFKDRLYYLKNSNLSNEEVDKILRDAPTLGLQTVKNKYKNLTITLSNLVNIVRSGQETDVIWFYKIEGNEETFYLFNSIELNQDKDEHFIYLRSFETSVDRYDYLSSRYGIAGVNWFN